MIDTFPLPRGVYRWGSGFRPPDRPNHMGVDLPAPEGTPVYAPVSGLFTVAPVQPDGAGVNVRVERDVDAWKMFHLSAVVAATGTTVRAGTLIGLVGHTGAVVPSDDTGAHLHVECHRGGLSNPVDPTGQLQECEQVGWFTDGALTDVDLARIETVLSKLGDRITLGSVSAAVVTARLGHYYLNQAVVRLGGEPLDGFTTNPGMT